MHAYYGCNFTLCIFQDEGNAEVKETDHRKNVSESVHTLTKTNADGKEIDHQVSENVHTSVVILHYVFLG